MPLILTRVLSYETIEVIRFDGKNADFKFEQLSKDSEQRIRIDQNPQSCLRCHGSDPRPLWDSYRAWPGMLTPRDDLVERDSTLKEPFLSLVNQIDEAKKKSPFQNELQKRLKLTQPRIVQTELQLQLDQRGWARVPHLPPTRDLKNQSRRTAEFAGPGHILFDQLSAELGCFMRKRLQKKLTPREWKVLNQGLKDWTVARRELNHSILERWQHFADFSADQKKIEANHQKTTKSKSVGNRIG